ncbi:MAG: alpha-galactosidase [Kiritimatiellae bacterium]|nr:alpha-galactosidase [Kiritimatiellia bacterium]MDD4026050.1 alpha-galactosidase [Kiritimatiellia bacterium]
MSKGLLTSVFLALAAAGLARPAVAGDGVKRPVFSFVYDGKPVSGHDSMKLDARLKVTVEKTQFPEADAIEWKLWFENTSAEKSGVVADVCDGDFMVVLPPDEVRKPGHACKPGDRAVIAMRGCVGEGTWDYTFDDESSATEFAPKTYYLREETWSDKISISNWNARSSNVMAPFFNVTYKNRGALVAIGWSGGWKADFENVSDGIKVRTGLKRTNFRLEPGEKIRTTSVLVMNYTERDEPGNKFRSLMRERFSHRATSGGKDREGLFAYELWGAMKSDDMITRVNEIARAKILPELIWIDAGWYGKGQTDAGIDFSNSDWPDYCGDWNINPVIHPDGFLDVAKTVREYGMGLMLWFTPECLGKKAHVKKEHPDWMLDPPGAGYALLNYGVPAAKRSTYDMLSRYIKKLGISCYRQDFNQGLDKHFALAETPERLGIPEVKHITAMYDLWDDLRANHPGLLIDNCASGGRRIDIETLRRSIPFFRSDYQCNWNHSPEVVQTHNSNISWWLPYTGCTTKAIDLYAMRSAYSSSWGFAGLETGYEKLAEGEIAILRKARADYLRVRRFFSRDFHNHGSHAYDLTSWVIWQYHDPETGEGCILAFRRPESPCDRAVIDLKGVSGNIEYTDLDSGKIFRDSGKFNVFLPEKRSCALFVYRAFGRK